ncbi:Transposon Ty3-I Gag-Pol polyprotein [Vitis vinifera]|uniref:Transposon Ty3-I Gag-Pol polyprotein n=1 Tax=Vitis vinifera TaxID=29760 RepID=A0A438JU11_VITVI|nr:Transposon Ty3-I Gag-Pol polyprotein [Vitis vinifera]
MASRLHQSQQCMSKRQFSLATNRSNCGFHFRKDALFLDAFSGYHQIPMSPDDEEKTAFITPHDLYCYKVMPFGLKNAGATYQRLMTKIFKPLIGHTEVYIDDIVVKSKTREQHVLHLQEVFHLLRKYGMKLNPSKCAFGPHPKENCTCIWRYQNGQSAPFYSAAPPKEQKPIYYVSRALADVETRYSKMELTALALRSAAQKLRPYFQAHPVIVLTDQPLRNILHKPDLTGRMLQWAIELSEFGIEFQPRLSMKGQVMADFVLEYSRRPSQQRINKQEWWTLRVDGASRSSGSGVGLLLQSPTGEHLEQAIRLGFSASNNEAEYEAILSGLDLALALSVSKLRIYSDSQLVQFTEWTIEKIKRADNRRADALAGIAASLPIKEAILLPIHVQPTPLAEISTAIPLRHPSGRPRMDRSFTGPYLRCLGHSEAQYVLAELHEGICGNHSEDDLWHIELIRKDTIGQQ